MPNNEKSDQKAQKQEWSGFAEIDRAISQNRLTAYRWKKAWADPWARTVIVVVVGLLLGFIAFVLVHDLIG